MGRFLCSLVLALTLTLGHAVTAQAQIVNVLDSCNTKKAGFTGRLALSAGFKSGNTNLVQAKTGFGVGYRIDPHLFCLVARARFGTKQPIEDLFNTFDEEAIHVSHGFAHLRYRYRLFSWEDAIVDTLEAEVFLQSEADKFRDLGIRFLAGVGPRISGKPFPNMQLAVGLAYMFEHEEYNKSMIGRATSHRVSGYIQLDRDLGDQFSLHNTTFLQPRFAGNTPEVAAIGESVVSHLRISSDSVLQIKVNSWLSVRVGLGITFNSKTPPNEGDLVCDDGSAAFAADPDQLCFGSAPNHIVDATDKAVKRLDVSFDTAFVVTIDPPDPPAKPPPKG